MFPCGRIAQPALTRRRMLAQAANGFGAVALSGLFAEESARAETASEATRRNPFEARDPQFPARAKNVIFLYMDGGPSQVDSFDPKQRLTRGQRQTVCDGGRSEDTSIQQHGPHPRQPVEF